MAPFRNNETAKMTKLVRDGPWLIFQKNGSAVTLLQPLIG